MTVVQGFAGIPLSSFVSVYSIVAISVARLIQGIHASKLVLTLYYIGECLRAVHRDFCCCLLDITNTISAAIV